MRFNSPDCGSIQLSYSSRNALRPEGEIEPPSNSSENPQPTARLSQLAVFTENAPAKRQQKQNQLLVTTSPKEKIRAAEPARRQLQ